MRFNRAEAPRSARFNLLYATMNAKYRPCSFVNWFSKNVAPPTQPATYAQRALR